MFSEEGLSGQELGGNESVGSNDVSSIVSGTGSVSILALQVRIVVCASAFAGILIFF